MRSLQVIRDAGFDEQTEESFEAVCAAKITGTEFLDLASRSACPRLDSFVVFSSVSCGRGNVGQTNYGYANSAMERICEERRQIGLPAVCIIWWKQRIRFPEIPKLILHSASQLAIQWGAIGDVGMVMKDLQGHNETKVAGTVPQRISSCLASLDVLLTCGRTVVACAVLADKDAGPAAGPDSLNIVDAVANILAARILTVVPDSPIRKMTSKSSDGSLDRPVFMIHPIQGTVDSLEELANQIERPVWGLQCTKIAPMDSAGSLAAHYLQVTDNLKNLPSREERLKFCSDLVGCSRETFETAVDLFWKKVDICRKFEPSRKPASSRIRLLKASQKFVDNVDDDYGLSKDCDCPVEVITIPSTTHQTIISGEGAERVAHIVNSN
ncbi:unnamed protein product [Nesidiocoris tenuis]|uniref:Ketoreductase (KR) domain-containing protein n=1 Tax=Nesidiocoris tenuis TaxID=355587 RepID=A0A6H5G361_9HEMI|nr:unnamed protein product [Nesidiocoris tenuis]CAB0015542.1 unnamed protein product [Nesidiocoris tenuis]CAB0015547.1 unnamed protein product [Nesidiocoris tenuis]